MSAILFDTKLNDIMVENKHLANINYSGITIYK